MESHTILLPPAQNVAQGNQSLSRELRASALCPGLDQTQWSSESASQVHSMPDFSEAVSKEQGLIPETHTSGVLGTGLPGLGTEH